MITPSGELPSIEYIEKIIHDIDPDHRVLLDDIYKVIDWIENHLSIPLNPRSHGGKYEVNDSIILLDHYPVVLFKITDNENYKVVVSHVNYDQGLIKLDDMNEVTSFLNRSNERIGITYDYGFAQGGIRPDVKELIIAAAVYIEMSRDEKHDESHWENLQSKIEQHQSVTQKIRSHLV